MTYDEEEEEKRRIEYENAIELKRMKAKDREKQEENLEKILQKQKKQAIKQSLDLYREEHRKKLENLSSGIKDYLETNVMDILADGLATICRQQPEDPVDALAEYLFRNSLRVPEPSPALL